MPIWYEIPMPADDPEQIAKAVSTLGKGADEVEGHRGGLDAAARSAGAEWQGAASVAFTATHQAASKALEATTVAHRHASRSLDTYHQVVSTAVEASKKAHTQMRDALDAYCPRATAAAARLASALEHADQQAAQAAARAAAKTQHNAGGTTMTTAQAAPAPTPSHAALIADLRAWRPARSEPTLQKTKDYPAPLSGPAIEGQLGPLALSTTIALPAGGDPDVDAELRAIRSLESGLADTLADAYRLAASEGPALLDGARSATARIQASLSELARAATEFGGQIQETTEQIEELPGIKQLMEANEWLHAGGDPLDTLAGLLKYGGPSFSDGLREAAEDAAEDAEELLGDVKEWSSVIDDITDRADQGLITFDDIGDLLASLGSIEKALPGIADPVAKAEALATSAARISQVARGLCVGLNVTAIAGDAFTLINPEDKGTMGWVDRSAALANGTLAGASVVEILAGEAIIPEPAGGIVMAGTGIYLASDYLYHHWHWFHDRVDDVGRFTADVGKDIANGAVDTAKVTAQAAAAAADTVGDAAQTVATTTDSVTSAATSVATTAASTAAGGAVNAADDAADAASTAASAVSGVASTIGGWL